MFDIQETRVETKYKVRSLCWQNGTLVDWVAGGHRYFLDGHIEHRYVQYAFDFDGAVVSPSGEYQAIYARRGTKGLLLHQGTIIREIDRSFYHANVYEYPVALLRLKSGQEVIAHCPEHYNRLEIEDLATGLRLTASDVRKPTDFFHSRLSATADGTFLLSAGWHWHPVDHVKVFNVEDALKDPSHLDSKGLDVDTWADFSSASFVHDRRLIVALANYAGEDEDDEDGEQSRVKVEHPFGVVRVFDMAEVRLLAEYFPESEVGTIMPVGDNHLLGFYEYPKLFEVQKGTVVHSWKHIASGKQKSSIIWRDNPVPPMACDTRDLRFAVANDTVITVVQLRPQNFS